MSKKLAIVQSNYIPWKGYFDLINMVDEFVLFDDVQYTRRDWRNRNVIKTFRGPQWLTIPVQAKGKYLQKIKDTRVSDPNWKFRHWKTIVHNYRHAEHFETYHDIFESMYLGSDDDLLSNINYRFILEICRILGIKTRLTWSMDYEIVEGKNERLIHLCRQANADEYVSGPSARSYLDADAFERCGIRLSFIDYSGYPDYHQLHPPFIHNVSIIDLIFNEGSLATKYMKSFRSNNTGHQ